MSTEKRGQELYTFGEELLNSISHGIGSLLAIAGTVLIIIRACFVSDAWGIVSASIYGFSLIVLYTMSTLYHALTNKTAKKVFRILDHTTIFLLIAGTYTPYTLVSIRGPLGWTIFGLVWGAAVLGIVFNSVSIKKFKVVSMILYIATGWVAVIALKPIYQHIGSTGFLFLILGGVLYTVGIIFYKMKSRRYFHGIWHFFVLAGSIFHFFSIFFYVMK